MKITSHLSSWLGTALCLGLMAACTQPKPATKAQPVAQEVQAPTERPDPGPTLTHGAGTASQELLTSQEVSIAKTLRTKDWHYLQAPLPPDTLRWLERWGHRVAHIALPDGVVGTAFVGTEPNNPDSPRILVARVRGALPASMTLTLHHATSQQNNMPLILPGQTQEVTLTGLPGATRDKALEARFLEVAALWFSSRSWNSGRDDAFSNFAKMNLSQRALKLPGATPAPTNTPQRQSDLSQMMDLYTGVTSVEEALQIDRALRVAPKKEARTLTLADVPPPPLPAHPWEAMIKELPQAPVMEPMADKIPQDMIYFHFHDLRTMVRVVEELDTWLTPLGRALENNPGPNYMGKRYQRQLALERTGLSKKLGHLAVHSTALVVGDPFLREGTDVSLVFHVRNQALLDTALAGYRQSLTSQGLTLSTQTWTHGAHKVLLTTSADGTVHQHRVQVGDHLLVSNSPGAIKSLLAVHDGTAPALSSAGDFQYMRARYPFDQKKEDGFLFLGDALIAKVIGPRTKILSARRLQARADLQALHYTALLHGWMEGRFPDNTQTMIQAGWMDAADLTHFDAEAILWDKTRGASSAAWGRPGAMTPLVDLTLDKVTQAEATAYKRFRDTYQSYWRGFIDPIGVQIKLDGDDLTVDARMLPLINQSEYNDLQEMVGQQTMQPPPLTHGAQMALAVGEDAGLRRFVDQMAYSFTGNRKLGLNWLGDWVVVGTSDRSGLWDAALGMGTVPMVHQPTRHDELSLLRRMPLFVAAHVRNSLGLAATLTAVRTYIDQAAAGLVTWESAEPHRDLPVQSLREANVGNTARAPITLYYVVVKDVFLMTLDRATLELQIDALMDAEPGTQAQALAYQPQSALTFHPRQGKSWMVQTLLGMIEHTAIQNHKTSLTAQENLLRAFGPARGMDPALGLTWLGYAPASVHGGAWSQNKGVIEHSLYGSEMSPKVPSIPIEASPVTQALLRLDSLDLELSFEGEGAHRGLHTRLRLIRQPAEALP